MYQKNDSYDAEAVALVLINMLDKLPDAILADVYWTLGQLVKKILELVRTDGQTTRAGMP